MLALSQGTWVVDLGRRANVESLTLYLGLAVLVRASDSMKSGFMKYEC